MNILAFDTCFDACSVAVGLAFPGPAATTHQAWQNMRTGHAEALLPMIADAMQRAGLDFSRLDLIAVTHGPGTFTGTRIGVAAGRGLALATGAPIVSASSLLITGLAAAKLIPGFGVGGSGVSDAVMVVRDARAGQFYAQIVGPDRLALTGPLICAAEQAAGLCPGKRIFVTGSGAAAVLAAAKRLTRLPEYPLCDASQHSTAPLGSEPDAAQLLELAPSLERTGMPVSPLYLRPPDAKPQASTALPRMIG